MFGRFVFVPVCVLVGGDWQLNFQIMCLSQKLKVSGRLLLLCASA
jgi:hypothetical protein